MNLLPLVELTKEQSSYIGDEDVNNYSDFRRNLTLEDIKQKQAAESMTTAPATQTNLGVENTVENSDAHSNLGIENTVDNSEAHSTLRTTEIIPDRRGPVHTLLKLGYHDKMHTIYEHDEEVLSRFLFLVLPDAVGKRKWNRMVKGLLVSRFVTFSDEAFAMILVENNAGKWLKMLLNPELSIKEKRRLPTKYTLSGDKQGGWTNDGIFRFTELTAFVTRNRRTNRDRVELVDRLCSLKYKKNKLERRDKRKLDELMSEMYNNDTALLEQQKLVEMQRLKDEKMNDILLNMCMKGSEYDITGDMTAI